MKLLINHDQLKLLKNFHLIEGNGLTQNGNELITESKMKEFLVSIIINGWFAQIRVGAQSGASSLFVVKKLFPSARVTGQYIPV